MKRQYSCKVISIRPEFPNEISTDESKVLLEHAAYWRSLNASFDKGPHPQQETYGLTAILFIEEEELASILANDPITKANMDLRIEHRFWPMQK